MTLSELLELIGLVLEVALVIWFIGWILRVNEDCKRFSRFMRKIGGHKPK